MFDWNQTPFGSDTLTVWYETYAYSFGKDLRPKIIQVRRTGYPNCDNELYKLHIHSSHLHTHHLKWLQGGKKQLQGIFLIHHMCTNHMSRHRKSANLII